tara:strand:- start:12125 stop:12919 length:795 start_codon:yes stop_codon:yes gene_type:complete
MLIICNGVFKSGSTWLHAIILEMLACKKIDVSKVSSKYTNNIKSPTTIIESRFRSFILNEDYHNKHYINKSHFYMDKTFEYKYTEDVIFVFSEREIKDSIVSHFFHIKHKYLRSINFKLYYWLIGRFKAYEIISFNDLYKKKFSKEFFFNYYDLKNNFNDTIFRIANILRLDSFNDNELDVIKSKTSLSEMRKNILNGESYYYSTVLNDRHKLIRKGEIGDHINFFSKYMLKDIDKIQNKKVSYIFRAIYYITFTFRRKTFDIE